jgi:peptide subunit release factor 1 (eRF1)
MRLSFSAELFAAAGPIASVYLDTSHDTENAVHAVALRWRALRDELETAGCPADLDVLGATIERLRGTGHTGHALFATGGRILYGAELHGPPRREIARRAPLPHLMPLVAQVPETVPHVLVVADRIGADVTTVGPSGEQTEESVSGDDYPIRKVAPGGWSQRRFQQRVEETWEHNARRVAEAVTDAAHACEAEVVLVAGEERATSELLRAFGPELQAEVVEVSSGGRAAGIDQEAFAAEVSKLLADRAASRLAAVAATYRQERGRGARATEGLDHTIAALRRAQVATLLVNDDPSAVGTLFVGPEPTHLAVRRDELIDLGVDAPSEDRVDAALVRTAAGTDADLVIVPVEELQLTGGVGALLRYAEA